MKFDYNESENLLTCTFTGRIDTNVSLLLTDQLNEKLNGLKGNNNPEVVLEGKVIFDMKEVYYIASSFIRICVNTAKQVNKGNFSLINCDPFLKKTFKIAGLDEIFNVL